MAHKLDPESIIGRFYGDGKPMLFVQYAVLIASTADELGGFLESLIGKSPPPAGLPPVPELSEWLPLYISHRRVVDAVGAALGVGGEVPLSQVSSSWHQLVRTNEPKRRRLIKIFLKPREVVRLVSELFKLLKGVPFPPDKATVQKILQKLDANSDEPESNDRFSAFMRSAEGQFVFRVWLPCWLIYHEYPPVLLRRARCGCLDSLEKLVRLDKAIASEPRLASQLHSLTRSSQHELRERFLRALSDPPKGRLDGPRLKTLLAGLISQIAIAMRCPVTSAEIAGLFDTVYQLRTGQSDESDPDLPCGVDFTRAIRNNRIWPSLPRR